MLMEKSGKRLHVECDLHQSNEVLKRIKRMNGLRILMLSLGVLSLDSFEKIPAHPILPKLGEETTQIMRKLSGFLH